MPAKKRTKRNPQRRKSKKKISRQKRPAKRSSKKRPARKKRTTRAVKSRNLGPWIRYGLVAGLLLLAIYVVYLDFTVREQFKSHRWAIPAHVYTRPLELYAGAPITRAGLLAELDQLGYRAGELERPGTYQLSSDGIRFHARSFTFWDGDRSASRLQVRFDNGRIRSLHNNGGEVEAFRLEPRLFGSVLPNRHEDRSPVRFSDVPKPLIDALISIEDRNFYRHPGIDPRGLARALWVNLTSGGVVQGGSTITQQLVKNFYLSADRTLQRKFTEMIMAVLLELHYEKNEIFETYINEVYLGQAGNRAIHGFGLASQFYFGRPLAELRLPELALLAALVKGPSYYNPRRHPQRARQRRNLVLQEMAKRGYLQQSQGLRAQQAELGVTDHGSLSATAYPAYMDMVRWQLQRDYRQGDLASEGLRIFTTLDPAVQRQVENAVASGLSRIEKQRRIKSGSLQAAAIVVRTDNGELQALLGGRRDGFGGFNRALSAQRSIGSLVKPALYLAALEHPERYSLATPLDDSPLTVQQRGVPDWRPQNYDKRNHGRVLLLEGLAHSYNVASARLGMDIGVPSVMETLRRLGMRRQVDAFPSLLLGAISLTPIEVTQIYLTLAGAGFRTPLRAVREVMTHDSRPLARYPLDIEQVVTPETMALLHYALQQVVHRGTAAALGKRFDPSLGLAGKTGTTDGYRDSWFAGYSGNYLTVVWVGRDDNKPTGLSGATGAMTLWADIMAGLHLLPAPKFDPTGIEYAMVALGGANGDCGTVLRIPFVAGTAPADDRGCSRRDTTRKVEGSQNKFLKWLRGIFK